MVDDMNKIIAVSILFGSFAPGTSRKHVPILPVAGIPARLAPVPKPSGLIVGQTKKDAPYTAGTNLLTNGHYCLQDCCRGVSTILAFGISNCIPCNNELPELIKIHKEGNLKVLYIDGDSNPLTGKVWLQRSGAEFPVINDTGPIHRKWGVENYPTCFLIGPDGKVEAYFEGFNPKDLEEMVKMGERLNPKNMEIKPFIPLEVGPLIPG